MSGLLPSWARRGAKVLCVDMGPIVLDGVPHEPPSNEKPPVGEIYTIRWAGFSPGDGLVCLRLKEVRRPSRWYRFRLYEPPFLIERFRPLVETNEAEEVEAAIYRAKQVHQPRTEKVGA